MSYPYPPTGPGDEPSGGQPGGWGGGPPTAGGYGASGPDWQHQETMMGGPGMVPPAMYPPPGTQPTYPPPGGPYPMGQYPMGQYPMGAPPKKGGAGVIIVAIVAAVVVVGGVIGGAYYAASHGDTSTRSSASASPSGNPQNGPQGTGGQQGSNAQYKPDYYDATKSWTLWDALNTASGDSAPLTLAEVFAKPEAKTKTSSTENITISMQGTGRLDSDCGSAVWGAALQSALRGYGCTQVVRAVYVSSDQRFVGQLVVFNLRDVDAANALIADMNPKVGGKGFSLPLTGPSPVEKFGTGSTGASGGAYGHFVVIGWAGRTDGQRNAYDTSTVTPASLVEQAGKEFLFTRDLH